VCNEVKDCESKRMARHPLPVIIVTSSSSSFVVIVLATIVHQLLFLTLSVPIMIRPSLAFHVLHAKNSKTVSSSFSSSIVLTRLQPFRQHQHHYHQQQLQRLFASVTGPAYTSDDPKAVRVVLYTKEGTGPLHRSKMTDSISRRVGLILTCL
jgi:hypothetical protein